MHGDGKGLYLKISRTGARSWIQRVVVAGRRRDLGLGRFPDVGLAQAREAAAHNRSLIAAGADPLAEKRKAAIPTFRQASERTFDANKPRWRNGKHTATWWQSLERHAFPIIGDMPVDQIGREDVLRVLTPIWGVRMETARRVRQRIRAVLKWAMAHGYIDHNVAGEMIDGALPTMPKVKNHLRALPYPEGHRIAIGWLLGLDCAWRRKSRSMVTGGVRASGQGRLGCSRTFLSSETIREFTGRPPRGWMGPGLTETFETPDYLAEAGIEYVADYPMDDQPFDIRTKHGTLTSIPYTVELNDIPMMLIQHHKAAEFYDQCMEALERLDREGERNARVMAIAVHPYISGTPFRIKYFEKVLDAVSGAGNAVLWTGSDILDWYLAAAGGASAAAADD